MSTTSPPEANINPAAVAHNVGVLSSVHFLSACFSGAAAGILGLTNFYGFLLFFVSLLFSALCISVLRYGRSLRTLVSLVAYVLCALDAAVLPKSIFLRAGGSLSNPARIPCLDSSCSGLSSTVRRRPPLIIRDSFVPVGIVHGKRNAPHDVNKAN
jgi:hypothetical protein